MALARVIRCDMTIVVVPVNTIATPRARKRHAEDPDVVLRECSGSVGKDGVACTLESCALVHFLVPPGAPAMGPSPQAAPPEPHGDALHLSDDLLPPDDAQEEPSSPRVATPCPWNPEPLTYNAFFGASILEPPAPPAAIQAQAPATQPPQSASHGIVNEAAHATPPPAPPAAIQMQAPATQPPPLRHRAYAPYVTIPDPQRAVAGGPTWPQHAHHAHRHHHHHHFNVPSATPPSFQATMHMHHHHAHTHSLPSPPYVPLARFAHAQNPMLAMPPDPRLFFNPLRRMDFDDRDDDAGLEWLGPRYHPGASELGPDAHRNRYHRGDGDVPPAMALNARMLSIMNRQFQNFQAPTMPPQGRLRGGLGRLADPFRHGERNASSTVECLLCCESVKASDVFECSRRHKCCASCLSQFILQNWRDLDDEHGGGQRRGAAAGEVRCCVPNCQSTPASMEQVVRLASRPALIVYMQHVVRMREAQCFVDAQAIVQEKAPEARDALGALFELQLQRNLTRARMCPHCKFGPIDFHGCDDLAYHHMELRSGGATVSNACPRCGFFAPNISDWLRWDGSIPKEDDPFSKWPGADERRDSDEFDDDDDDDDHQDEDDYPHDLEEEFFGHGFFAPLHGRRNLARTIQNVTQRVLEILPSARRVDLTANIARLLGDDPDVPDDDLVSDLIEFLLTDDN